MIKYDHNTNLLVIDNYDSFTYNLVGYCQELGAKTTVVYNDSLTIADIQKINPDKILLSPGPGRPEDSGICLDVIANFYKIIPILGVCLGHQCIGHYFGGKIIHAARLMHGKTSVITHNNVGIFKNIKNDLTVARYHSLVISSNHFPSCLRVTAFADTKDINQKEIMAIQHKNYNLFGVQFHPEAILSECGHEILNNFLCV
ncbi:MAG: aminodeoxychorismate/anthranilate synthase component II [Gammaproteobacteria bacterium]|nr:aminodeoxychorismate/anthranilate synthase component II [Gammaproteobacteria bacterium]